MAIALVFFTLLSSAAILPSESAYIAYNTTHRIFSDKLNVHLVPHSHDDVGWLKTVDQYYVGANNSIRGACVQNVLDSVISALLDDKNRKFIYVEMAFFQRWWRQQSDAMKVKVKELVNSGQLEFINGGMCMHDEATPHYIDLIDQTTLGHQFIKDEFRKVPRVGWQIDPFGHSAVQAYLLGAELGFDSLFFARIDYQDRAKRLKEKSLEIVWQGSKSLGSSSQIFTGIFPRHYDPPDGFTFEINDVSPPIQDDALLFDYNVQERVNDFVTAALTQANVTRTNHIMWTMGTDFRYQYANSWFRQMDKFIHYVNEDGRVNAFYSTPSMYTDAKYAAKEKWPLKTEDFFPYADYPNAYWTGYFTSRPAFKGYVRIMSGYYLAARQLEFFQGRSNSRPNTDALADALSIAQHHDAVSGTERQHVAADYAKRLYMGYEETEKLVSSSLAFLADSRASTRPGSPVTNFQQCPLLNISYCPPSEAALSDGKSLVVVVYNPLGWRREEVIRIPVSSEKVFVLDSDGREIESQLLPVSNASLSIRNFYVKAYTGKSPNGAIKYWLAFSTSVPPLGFSTYIVSSAKQTGPTSTISSVFTSAGSTDNKIEVGQGSLKLLYSSDEGKLTHYVNSRTLVAAFAEQSYNYYSGYDGTYKDSQASGAYIFRPNGTYLINSEHQVPLTVFQGPVLDEVHQQLNPWISQVTRVFKGKEHAEVEFIIGPIPVDDGIGKEITTQIRTTMNTNKTFYTDSKGEDPYRFFTWKVTFGDIYPLGVKQQGILINGQFPGPQIDAVTNDNLVINVFNYLREPLLISWDGIQQRRNSWQDGVYGTNCPIRPGKNFTYFLQVKDQIGSYFYFPSFGFQKAAGGFGGIRIWSRPGIPVPFPSPAGDFTVLAGDWFKTNQHILRRLLDSGRNLPFPDGLLINGRGYNGYTFTVDQGKTYRFRISNVGLTTSINFRIQGHTMKLVEVEGSHTLQNTYTSLDIHLGQSYSVLVTADQPVKDYYIVVSSRFTTRVLTTTAILHYSNSRTGVSGPVPTGPTTQIASSLSQARSIRWNLTASGPRPNPQGSYHYGMIKTSRTIMLANSAPYINGKQRYAVNSVSFVPADTPLKLADYFKIPGVFYVGSIPTSPTGGSAYLQTSVMGADFREYVEIVFQNWEDTVQSWHIDGYAFFVVGMDGGQWTPASRARYNLRDTVARSTTQVYPRSWTAIYMALDNVGMWNIRSQNWARQYLGQQFYLRVFTSSNSLRDENPIPKNALLCGRARGRHTRPL